MNLLKSGILQKHFRLLKQQRIEFYQANEAVLEHPWKRPLPDKWSIGETLYHLFLMARLFRRFSNVYIPLNLPVASVRKTKPYQTELYNIYDEYNQKKKRAMKAPSVINPPTGLEKRWNITEIQWLLDYETEKLEFFLQPIHQDMLGQIHYPDPIAHYPNVIQSVHLLAIHEQHHFNLTEKYFKEALVTY